MITLNNVSFAWNKTPIIDIPSLTIEAGQHLFLEGPSGSGKSTLLNLLAGVLTPQQGKITVLGQDLTQLTSSQNDQFRSNHIGFIFQQFNLIPYLSVLENVTLPCRFSRIRKQKSLQQSATLNEEAIRLLSNLGLDNTELQQRNVNELSVGQQQRVAAARAMIGSPDIIIADEPTSALDADHRDAFINSLFTECEKENITLIFVSHDSSLEAHFPVQLNLNEVNQANSSTKEVV